MTCKRPDFLEGMRGLAAWVVVLHHLSLALIPILWCGSYEQTMSLTWVGGALAYSPLNLLSNGSVAVMLFFVHSGFVLSFKFFNERGRDHLRSAAVRRYFRLAIPAAASVLIAWALMSVGWIESKEAAALDGNNAWLADNLNFTPHLLGALHQGFIDELFRHQIATNLAYNPVLWTIGTEFLGSFLVFGVLALFGSVKNRWIWYAGTLYALDGVFLQLFVIGAMICDVYVASSNYAERTGYRMPPALARSLTILTAVLGIYLTSYRGYESPYHDIIAHFVPDDATAIVQGLGTAFIVIAILLSKGLQAKLETKFFRRLGELSFSVYLIHLAVIASLGSFLMVHLTPVMPESEMIAVVFFVCIAAVAFAAIALRKFVDVPAIRFSHWFYARFAAEKAPAQGAAVAETPPKTVDDAA